MTGSSSVPMNPRSTSSKSLRSLKSRSAMQSSWATLAGSGHPSRVTTARPRMSKSGCVIERTFPGRLSQVSMDGELPRREDLGLVFDELDYQMACQVYLWALPLVSYAQWRNQHYEVFGATSSDLVHYVSYADRLGLITANATTPYILNFFDLSASGPRVIELPAGPTAGGVSDLWQREVGAMGEMGPDRGQGGKYVILGPGMDEPDGLGDDYRT